MLMTHLKLISRILFILKVKGLRFKEIHERSNMTGFQNFFAIRTSNRRTKIAVHRGSAMPKKDLNFQKTVKS